MNEQASPLGGMDVGDIGAALAAAGSQAINNQGSPNGGQMGNGGPSGNQGGDANRQGAPSVQSLDFILDIPLKVTVELGRSKMAIREILQLAQGSVIELAKFAGEPLEVLVNDKLIARGEVVVVNEKFGIRLTDIISPVERIEQLK